MAKFKIGDIVELKSGGPIMTVTGFAVNEDETQIDETHPVCAWFDVTLKNRSAIFPEDALDEGNLDDALDLDDILDDDNFRIN